MRIQITQPADWLEAFRARAESEGKSLSAWIGEQCKKSLNLKQQARLSKRLGVGPQKKDKQCLK